MNSRKHKSWGRDIEKGCKFLVDPALMSVLPHIHCEALYIQNLAFSPLYAAGPSDITEVFCTKKDSPAFVLPWRVRTFECSAFLVCQLISDPPLTRVMPDFMSYVFPAFKVSLFYVFCEIFLRNYVRLKSVADPFDGSIHKGCK